MTELAEQIRLVGEGVTVVLGMTISYVALRGYYQNQSTAMLFVGSGFALVIGVPAVIAGLTLLFSLPVSIVSNVIQLVEILGLVSILYGLRYDP